MGGTGRLILRSNVRCRSIDKNWHSLHVLLTEEIRRLAGIAPMSPPLDDVVMGRTETPFDAGYGKVRFLTPDVVCEVPDALSRIPVEDLPDPHAANASLNPTRLNEGL